MNKKAFTLIELLAVIVILAIIMAIAIPKIMNVIENSKKDTLVSGTKIIAKAIQADSISTGKQYYKLTSTGILYRCNDGQTCEDTTQVKYKGELISFSGDSVIFVKNDDGSVELSSGTICEKSKKYCFEGTEGNPISLKTVNISSIISGSSVTTTTSGTTTTTSTTTTTGSNIIASGDISNAGNGSVLYELNTSGVLTVTGTGVTKSSDSDADPWNRVSAKIIKELIYDDLDIENINSYNEVFGLTTDELINFATAYFAYIYASPETMIENFVDWFYTEYGFYPGFVTGDYVTRSVAVSDYQFLFSVLFGEENANMAFNYTKTNSLVIDSGITEIGIDCFKTLGINNLVISSTVSKIDDGAFGNNFLESVTLPNSVSLVKWYAFGNNHLTSIEIHSGILTLDNDSFCGNPNLVNPTFFPETTQSGSYDDPNLLGGGCKGAWDY